MTTLVIHTKDFSTEFLKPLYSEMFRTIVVNYDIYKDELLSLIQLADVVMLLGHGTEKGLLRGDYDGYIVDKDIVDALQDKVVIGIWCYASTFAKKYNLKGLFSGMFISEQKEAEFEGFDTTEQQLEQYNKEFVELLDECLNVKRLPLTKIAEKFNKYADICDGVKKFNYSKIVSYDD